MVKMIRARDKLPTTAPGSERLADDPVRLYLNQISQHSLLNREAEVRISRRLEEARAQVQRALLGSHVAVEQAASLGWERYVGRRGATVCMESFGASAPLPKLLVKFGFTVERVVAVAKDQIAKHG